MKQTFTNRYFNWVLIAITLLSSIGSLINIFNEFEFFSNYLVRIIFALTSILALISLIAKNGNGEKYSRFFIIVQIIIPSLLVFNEYLTYLLFYGLNRINLIQSPIIYLNITIGIILFLLTVKYSRENKLSRINDYGILISYFGIFLIALTLIRSIENSFFPNLNKISIWETTIKSIIAISIIFLGYRLVNQKIKLKTCIILSILSMFIYGLI